MKKGGHPRAGWSVTLFGEQPPNRTQTRFLTHSGALIPEIVRRGFQDLLEAEVFRLRN